MHGSIGPGPLADNQIINRPNSISSSSCELSLSFMATGLVAGATSWLDNEAENNSIGVATSSGAGDWVISNSSPQDNSSVTNVSSTIHDISLVQPSSQTCSVPRIEDSDPNIANTNISPPPDSLLPSIIPDGDGSDWEAEIFSWYARTCFPKVEKQNNNTQTADDEGQTCSGSSDEEQAKNRSSHSDYRHYNGIDQIDDAPAPATVSVPSKCEGNSCPLCHRNFSSKYLARIHIDSLHRGLNVFKCVVCDKSFPNPRRRFRHIHVVHGAYSEPQRCSVFPECTQTFKNPVARKEHMQSCHRNLQKNTTCRICSKSDFKHERALQKHLLFDHTPREADGSIQCIIDGCTYLSKSYTLFRRHLLLHSEPEKHHACGYPGCLHKFVMYTDLVNHRRTAHDTCFQCNQCGKKYLLASRYEAHVQKCTGEIRSQSFRCPIETCVKSVTSVRNLNEHMANTHLRLRYYECAGCLAQFTTQNAATLHAKKRHDPPSSTRTIYKFNNIDTEWKISEVCKMVRNKELEIAKVQNGDTAELEDFFREIFKSMAHTPEKKRRTSSANFQTKKRTITEPCSAKNSEEYVPLFVDGVSSSVVSEDYRQKAASLHLRPRKTKTLLKN